MRSSTQRRTEPARSGLSLCGPDIRRRGISVQPEAAVPVAEPCPGSAPCTVPVWGSSRPFPESDVRGARPLHRRLRSGRHDPKLLGRSACLPTSPLHAETVSPSTFHVAPFCHFAAEAATPLQPPRDATHHVDVRGGGAVQASVQVKAESRCFSVTRGPVTQAGPWADRQLSQSAFSRDHRPPRLHGDI